MKRGISALLTVTILSAVALSVFTTAYMLSQRRATTSITGLDKLTDYVHHHEVTKLAMVVAGDIVSLKNLGSKPVELEYLVLLVDDTVVVRSLSDTDACRLMDVDEMCIASKSRGNVIAAITRSGVLVFPERVELQTSPGEATLVIPITFSFRNLDEMGEELDIDPELIAKPYPGGGGKRGIGGRTVLMLPRGREDEYLNELVSTDCPGVKEARVRFGVLVVGYDPSWVKENASGIRTTPRYSIMFAGPPMPGEKICTSRETIPLTQQGFRVKVSNFTGTIRVFDSGGRLLACSSSTPGECGNTRSAIGVWYYGLNLGWRVYIHGRAGYLGYYQRSPAGQGQEASYEPYIFLGDIDGNGLVDIVFITEDAYYGDRSALNEQRDDLVDYSTEPLRLALLRVGYELGYPDGWIDGSRYAGIVLYMNLVFHDNSHPDETQLEDIDRTDWVLRILLVDQHGNELVIREYRYQEICNYHKTVVWDLLRDNYFAKISQSVYIPIPGPGKYRVVVAIQDPYNFERIGSGWRNDAEVTVGIEIIGVVPLLR